MVGVATELQYVPLSDAQMLEELPGGVRTASAETTTTLLPPALLRARTCAIRWTLTRSPWSARLPFAGAEVFTEAQISPSASTRWVGT